MRLWSSVLLALLWAIPGWATTLEVGSGKTYSTIQAAVNALPTGVGAAAGYDVVVYPGTYAEQVTLPDNVQGTTTSPVILRAAYPARKPLWGSTWASDTGNRAVINATGYSYGIANTCECSSTQLKYWIIEGFYITGASVAAIFVQNEEHFWIRNNVAYNTGTDTDENGGGFALLRTPYSLVQNNLWELAATGTTSSAGGFVHGGTDSTYEFNECRLSSGVSGRGRCFYFDGTSTNAVVKYNFLNLANQCNGQCWRMRDTTGQTIQHNYVYSATGFEQAFLVWHENTDAGKNEQHNLSYNTFNFVGKVTSNYDGLGLGWLNNTTLSYNIFVAGTNDTDSYALGPAWSDGSHTLTLTSNVYYNFIDLDRSTLCAPSCTITETGTSNTDPSITASTGCSATLNDETYGANLDVSQIPYRECDGSDIAVSTKFGMPGAVSDVVVRE